MVNTQLNPTVEAPAATQPEAFTVTNPELPLLPQRLEHIERWTNNTGPNIPPEGRWMLVILGRFCDPQGRCFPSHQRIQTHFGKSLSTCKRVLENLEALGLIETRKLEGGDHRHNEYILQGASTGWVPRFLDLDVAATWTVCHATGKYLAQIADLKAQLALAGGPVAPGSARRC